MSDSQAAVTVVTIDGPSGSGKGTIASLLARELNWGLLDSGALYRLTALAAMNHGVDFADEASLEVLAGHFGCPVYASARWRWIDYYSGR